MAIVNLGLISASMASRTAAAVNRQTKSAPLYLVTDTTGTDPVTTGNQQTPAKKTDNSMMLAAGAAVVVLGAAYVYMKKKRMI